MRKTKIDEIQTTLRDSIITEVKDIDDFHARPDKTREGGFYSIPRSVFSYTDYLVSVAKLGNKAPLLG